jgi:hypothetical protein
MALSDKELREVFHLVFLESLLRISDPKLFVLKGGVNLRFFLQSPRYSEDMDLDVLGGSVTTLKKNGYKILESPAFRRTLATFGIVDLKINDPTKAKQTETTQRFRVRLINQVGEEFPTKVEFSRRNDSDEFREDSINPEITGHYKRLSFRCQHYTGPFAIKQKIKALAGRPQTQARDIFDLYLLYLGGHFSNSQALPSKAILAKATENALSITYDQYRDQVEEYLSTEGKSQYGGRTKWNQIQIQIVDQLS